MTRIRFVPLFVTLAFALACTGAGDTLDLVKDADTKFKAGDLPGGAAELDKAKKDHPDSMYVAEDLAYSKMMAGDYAGADKALDDASKTETAKKDANAMSEIQLRRALVALRTGDLDHVRDYGEQSKLPAGLVLAAEVYLADADSDGALKLLKQAESDPGVAGQTAKTYADMMESTNQWDPGLAEATALWALGQRDVAVASADELVRALPDDREDKDALLLLWAGRAVTSGKSGIASGLLDAMSAPPPDQAWRVQATKAMIAIADGKDADGIAIFTALASAGAPADGLSDALATAAALTKNKDTARQLAGELTESAAAARGLWEAGAVEKAKNAAPDGSLKKYLESAP